MAIPVYLQNFKHAGLYRVVFDKSTVLSQDTNVLRLLVGYSDKGPFNIPTYIQSAADFIAMYGNINKTQERRGNFFHRTALQMLSVSPILCLNLKKFDTENVTGAQINTNFNAKDTIDTVQIPVADVYDTTRFWSLDPEKLNEVRGSEYINIATTDVKANSGTFFIRKASGSKVSSYNVTVSDWYKDAGEAVPEFLEGYENELMSAFFAEVYVFSGKFTADQVLASETLKNYFIVDKNGKLKLRQYVKDSFGDYNDTLDYLFEDETSGAIGHYVGCLIPYFKDKNGNYASLDIIFNLDSDAHHMMMSFNEDMLYEYGTANIDMSGARWISTSDSTPDDNTHIEIDGSDVGHKRANIYKQYGTSIVCIDRLWKGTALTSLLGNVDAPVVSAKTHFRTNIWSDEDTIKHPLSYKKSKKISGNMYVQSWTNTTITLGAIGKSTKGETQRITIDLSMVSNPNVNYILYELGAAYKKTVGGVTSYVPFESGLGTVYKSTDAYDKPENTNGPKKVITSLSRDLDSADDDKVILSSEVVKCDIEDVYITTKTEYLNPDTLIDTNNKYASWNVYGPSVTFIPLNENWTLTADVYDETDEDAVHTYHLTAPATADTTILAMLQKGDQFLAVDGKIDMDGDGDYSDEVNNGYYDLCYVQETETITDEYGNPKEYSIKFTGNIATYEGASKSDKDVTISNSEYNLLDATDQAKYSPKNWLVSYKKTGPRTLTAEAYDAATDKTGFVASAIVFSKQVTALEYNTILNDTARSMCTKNYHYHKIATSDSNNDNITGARYKTLSETEKKEYKYVELDTWTFVYNDIKQLHASDAGLKKPIQVTTSDGGQFYVDGFANDDLNVGKTITTNTIGLKYDGTDKIGYYVATYTNPAFKFGSQLEILTDAEYQNIKPISAEKYNGLTETEKTAYNSTTANYTENRGIKSSETPGHYLIGYSELVANTNEWIKTAAQNETTYGKYLVRIENGLNQEIGTMEPVYLKGYTYEHPKPDGVGQRAKLEWQNFQLSALTEYKGLRTGLLNKSEIDFRYVIDGFETYVDAGAKKVLSYLAKQKQNAFAILNFPSVKTFVKCPYSSFTDAKGVFNVQYVIDGFNKKKAHTTAFSLPSNDEGASFAAFYTPLKLSDGTIDSVVPSAGLVSNLFMEKYNSRLPYEIVAGPNYGAMSVSGLVGPDYNYSSDELNIIEPFGVNCMVYRPSFGTFINANQTAKQTPKSALSSVNVRELVIYIMDEVEKILQSYQWEFNNQTVRNKIKDRADSICARVQANGGIQAYLNVMDDSNNTPDIIDNEMAILSTHIEPGRGMGKMVHELTLYRTGQMNSTILGE
jgi:hypothetical protein